MKETTYLYLMHQPEYELHKIGISRKPRRRLSQIKCISGLPTFLVITVGFTSRHEAYRLEQKLKERFYDNIVSGEWFSKISKDDVLEIIHSEFAEITEKVQTFEIPSDIGEPANDRPEWRKCAERANEVPRNHPIKKDAQRKAWTKADSKRVVVVGSIRVNNSVAPEISKRIDDIAKKHHGKKNVAILAAIEKYAESLERATSNGR